MSDSFIKRVLVDETKEDTYPFSIPSVKDIESLSFESPVTFLVGENGSGKSTIIEALAVAAGFNAEGGTKNYNFTSQNTTSRLANSITLVRGAKREKYGYFLRAESFYTTANYADSGTVSLGGQPSPLFFNGKRIHQQSHGEAFLSIVNNFQPGLFIFDEPESALSPNRLLHLMATMHELQKQGSQFIVSSHSPILLAYPNAKIYELSNLGISKVDFDDLEHVQFTRDFLNDPNAFIRRIFD